MIGELSLAWICLGVFLLILVWLLIARIIRQRYPFPIPYFMIHFIDNPIRRMVQPLHKHPEHLGIKPGLTVLEIGPGSGTYTLATAEALGPQGKIIAIDIEERVVEYVRKRIVHQRMTNIEMRQGDAQALAFESESFDAIYAIAVFGEIPDRGRALREFKRVLVPGGTLAISELLPDPDSQPAARVRAECENTGFRFQGKTGNWLYFTLIFDNPDSKLA